MLPHDPTGKTGPKMALPDHVIIIEPKDEPKILEPYSQNAATKKELPPVEAPVMSAPIGGGLPMQQPMHAAPQPQY